MQKDVSPLLSFGPSMGVGGEDGLPSGGNMWLWLLTSQAADRREKERQVRL